MAKRASNAAAQGAALGDAARAAPLLQGPRGRNTCCGCDCAMRRNRGRRRWWCG